MRLKAAWMLLACAAGLASAGQAAGPAELGVDQIVERNIAARGGLEAWHKVQTMVWAGHIESPDSPAPSLPFVLEMKRPNKTRFEISALGQKSVRAFDGRDGWKSRAGGAGRPAVQPFTADELSYSRDEPGIDGMLIDYRADGTEIALAGIEEVDGRKAYRLDLKLRSGASRRVWIDAQSFLEVKADRETRSAAGGSGRVAIAYRNYRSIDGLQIPLMIETGLDSGKPTDKMVIERVAVNPPLPERAFTRPAPSGRERMRGVDAAAAAH